MPTPRARRFRSAAIRSLVATVLVAMAAASAVAATTTRPMFERPSTPLARRRHRHRSRAQRRQCRARRADRPQGLDRDDVEAAATRPGPQTQGGLSPSTASTSSSSQAVKTRLEALGATVRMTRTTNDGWGPCVDVRGQFGEKVSADLLVSIHADGATSSARGFHILRPASIGAGPTTSSARRRVWPTAMRTGMRSVGLPQANYYTTSGIKTRTDLGTLNHVGRPGHPRRVREHEEQHRRGADGEPRPAEPRTRTGSWPGILEYFGQRP